MIISPTYLGNHNYVKYEDMKNILSEYLHKEDNIIIDIDFLHANEIDSYLKDIAIPVLHDTNSELDSVEFQTKSREKMRKLIRIFKSMIQVVSPVVSSEGFYIIKLYL